MLSRRQQEVADLVAEGLSNRAIAECLFISERTVEGHVEQIRATLGLRSRAQVAAWVVEQRHRSLPLQVPATPPATHGDVRVTRRRAHRLLLRAGAPLLVLGAVGGWIGIAALRSAPPQATLITVAGGGIAGDGARATAATLDHPVAVLPGADGSLVLLDGNRVRRVAADGVITTVAGTTTAGFGGDGSSGAAVHFDTPLAVAEAPSGVLYVADTQNNRVRQIDTSGRVTTIAGTGVAGSSGDGGPAVAAELSAPAGVALGFGGVVYVADSGNDRVRAITPDGRIATVAGTGDSGYAGDGGPATSAVFDDPQSLAVDDEDNLYVADALNDRVRRIDVAGTVTTVAGDGTRGFSGDGGPATVAALDLASGEASGGGDALAVDGAGDLFVADAVNHRIRRVDLAGVITTVAGTASHGYDADSGPPTSVRLDLPLGVAVAGERVLYIADSGNGRVRRVVLSP